MKGDYQIPFNKDGDQQSYAQSWWEPSGKMVLQWDGTEREGHISVGPNWVDNYEFEDTLILVDYGRGRSSVIFEFERKSNGNIVTMFISDFFNCVFKMTNGQIQGRFTFTKKGQNYGCKLCD